MASVTFSEAVGGDGSTITDDGNPTTGLGNDGHRERLVPALTQLVAVAENVVSVAESVADVGESAELAESWADNDEDVEVEPGKYSAKHHSAKSESSAASASNSATSAANSATAAASSASAAATSESNAGDSETAAGTSATNAAASATAAADSATAASNSATAAADSASATAADAVSTAADRVAAESAKDDAETAETNAQASASSAATDKSLAETARDSAISSATTATTQADLAQKWATETVDVIVSGGQYSSLHYSTKALDSAELAAKWAEEDEDVEVTTGEYSAKHHAIKASDYADAAAASYASLAGEVAQAEDAANLAEEWANNPENTVVTGTSNYSARHWAIQAQASATGALIYRGSYNASGDVAPSGPNELGDYYKISVAGDFGGHEFKVGDSAIYNGSGWDKVDNTESVTSVAGRLGDVTLDKGDVGLGYVQNVNQQNASNINAGTLNAARLPATINADTTGNAATATDADTLDGEHGAYYLAYSNFTGTPTIPDTESIQDIIGGMVSGNTETGITVTYEDSDGTLDFILTDGGTAAVGTHEATYDHSTYLTETSADALYLGLTAKATDSALLNGEAASYYLDYTNFTNTPSTIDAEQVEDIVGAMLTGNTETGITVTYDDADGTIDFVLTDGGAAAVSTHESTYDHDDFVTNTAADAAYLAIDGTADNSDLLGGQDSAYHLNRANHTGTQLLATISDAGDAAAAGVKRSIEIDSANLQLVGDSASPGNNKVYGTNASGVRGWQSDFKSGGGQISAAVTYAPTVLAGSVIDCSLGNYFRYTFTTNKTISFTNVPSGYYVAVLEFTNGGNYTITWPASLDGDAPQLSTSAVDVLVLTTDDGGTSWRYVHSISEGG
ncbi:hypothetical protein [Zhongshania aliphaticivorans]|uniref:hypothetical protein n=1 Tax=Zhongshania aliphaticivorans TaxID=1470434 RepID=UPI0012E48D3F|nr:hypothetical protein [Zhongshania aliphaticivorans]CAA0103631.1 Uncharacterised protein [Zhongshania aliphaticivorans]